MKQTRCHYWVPKPIATNTFTLCTNFCKLHIKVPNCFGMNAFFIVYIPHVITTDDKILKAILLKAVADAFGYVKRYNLLESKTELQRLVNILFYFGAYRFVALITMSMLEY